MIADAQTTLGRNHLQNVAQIQISQTYHSTSGPRTADGWVDDWLADDRLGNGRAVYTRVTHWLDSSVIAPVANVGPSRLLAVIVAVGAALGTSMMMGLVLVVVMVPQMAVYVVLPTIYDDRLI